MTNKLNKKQQEIYNWLIEHPGYLKKSADYIINYQMLKGNFWGFGNIEIALKQARIDSKQSSGEIKGNIPKINKSMLKQLKLTEKNRIKRLYFDIETTPNIVYSWNVGYKLNIDYNNLIKERCIICICYKWEGESTVNYLTWTNGDDTEMIHKFYDIFIEADEIIGHNGDSFDVKWFCTRCLFHGILNMPDIKSIDTLKLSRKHFRFNSNRLDYIGQFLGLGKKTDTGGFSLWKDVMANDKKALDKMVTYCQNDVLLLEKVYNKLNGYSKPKTNVALLNGGTKCDCPKCGSSNYKLSKTRVTSTGLIKKQLQCIDCSCYYTVSNIVFEKS